MRNHLQKRWSTGIAAASAASLAAAMVGFTAPANAVSAPLTYDCNAPVIGSTPFTVVNDSNAPTTMFVGQSVPIALSSIVTVPTSLAGLLSGIGAATVAGAVDAVGSIGTMPSTAHLTVPSTAVPSTGDLIVRATGSGGTFKALKPGTYPLKAGNFTSTLNLFNLDGTPNGVVPSAQVPCTAPTGVSTTFDTITVKKDTTKTKVSAKNVRQGKKAVVKVTVTSKHGMTATGKVKVVLTKGKKVITKKVATLKKGMAKVTLPRKLTKKGTYKAVATYAGNSLFVGSKATHKVKVK